MFNNTPRLQSLLIGLVVIAFFIARQFSARPIVNIWTLGAPVVLAYIGLQGLSELDAVGLVLLGANLSIGVVFGFLRGVTFQVWTNDRGAALMRGTALTLALWLATFGVKIGLSILERQAGLGALATSNAEIWLPAAATLAAQTVVVYLRSLDLPLATA